MHKVRFGLVAIVGKYVFVNEVADRDYVFRERFVHLGGVEYDFEQFVGIDLFPYGFYVNIVDFAFCDSAVYSFNDTFIYVCS